MRIFSAIGYYLDAMVLGHSVPKKKLVVSAAACYCCFQNMLLTLERIKTYDNDRVGS